MLTTYFIFFYLLNIYILAILLYLLSLWIECSCFNTLLDFLLISIQLLELKQNIM